jgi:hypothetical protein
MKQLDQCLEQYLKEPASELPEKIKKLDELICTLGGPYGTNALNVEKAPLNLLLDQKAKYTYPALNPACLEISNNLRYNGKTIKLPKFSVYPIDDPNFTIEIRIAGGFCTDSHGYLISITDKLPRIFAHSLFKSTDFAKYPREFERRDDSWQLYVDRPTSQIIDRYGTNNVRFTSTLNVILPEKTKAKLQESTKLFKKENLFFIAETKPEEWNAQFFTYPIDPLLVGVINDKCYLIDSFNATPLENYVAIEWTSNANKK